MKVVIIGGGVVGLLCAYYLQELGARVVVLERGRVGEGCSYGNMGWVCPSIATPLPTPGLTLQSLRWLTDVESPLYIKPSAVPRMAAWLWSFHSHCNRVSYEHGLHALGALTERTPELYDGLLRSGIEFDHSRTGLLLAYAELEKMQVALRDLRRMRSFGVGPIAELDSTDLRTREPGLSDRLVGALLVESDRHVRPETLTAGVRDAIIATGGVVREGVSAQRFRADPGRVRAVLCEGLAEEADAFVLAAGAETGFLTKRLGIRLPIQAGKGYSITVQNPQVSVAQATYFAGVKVGLTPFGNALRIAGTMELSGINRRLDRRRLKNLERAVRRYIPGALDGDARSEWVGMRPITPDGLPVIGRLPGLENVYVASGHQMLGVTLAPATGLALAHLIVEGRSPIELAPFSPDRF